MFENVLCIPCLGHQIPNFFYDIFERKSSHFLSNRGAQLDAGDAVFGWSIPMAKGTRKGFLSSMFSQPEMLGAVLASPVSGQLLAVNKYESFFSDKTETTSEVMEGFAARKIAKPEDIACFIGTNEIKVVSVEDFYRPLKRSLSLLLQSPHHSVEEVYRNYDFQNYEPLREIVVQETNNLDKVICPTISFDGYEKLLRDGDVSTQFFR